MERQAKHQNISFALKNPLNDYQKQTTDMSYKDFYTHVRICMFGNSCWIVPIGPCMLHGAHWDVHVALCPLGSSCCIANWAVHVVLCPLGALCLHPFNVRIGLCMLHGSNWAVHAAFCTFGYAC
jgi:hypothetical protein